jgi:WD40 repeat protein
MRRMIREKDPERPSMRLSSLQAEERTTAAQRRNIALPDLIRNLRGDLDWIVIKALEKDRTRRYETANGLAADIKRHLENEPIVARPPSTVYRLQKAWKRNKGTYAAVVCVFMALLVGAVVSLWQAYEAKLAKDSESNLLSKAEENADLANLMRETAEKNEHQAIRLADEMLLRSYAADMKSVQTDLLSDNMNRARMTLDRYRPSGDTKDIRDFAWRYYWTQTRGMDDSNFEPHDGVAHYVTYSPDGRLLVTAGFDGQIKVWAASNQQNPIKIFDYPFDDSKLIYGGHMPFAPDGTLFATVQNGKLKIFDTRSWNVIKELETPYKFPLQFASNDLLIQRMPPNKLKIFDLKNENQFTIPGLRWNSDGKGTVFVAPYNSDDPIAIYKLPNINPVAEFESNYISNIRFTPSGNYVIHVNFQGLVTIRSTKNWEILHETKTHTAEAWGLAISPDEKFLATGGTDQLIKISEFPTLKHVTTLKGHVNEVWHLSFSKDGKTLVSAGKERKIRFWDMESILSQTKSSEIYPEENFHRIRTGIQKVWSFSKQFRNPQYWRVDGGKLIKDFQLKDVFPPETIFSEDGKIAAAIKTQSQQKEKKNQNLLFFFDTATGEISETMEIQSDYKNPKCFSPDNQFIVFHATKSVSENIVSSQLALFDLHSHKEIRRFDAADNIRNYRVPQFSTDGSLFAFRAPNWEVHVWNVKKQEMHSVLKGHEWNVYTLALSEDGSLIATGSIDGYARIWDVNTGKQITPPLVGHVRGVNRCVFTPDNKTLLTSGDDNSVRMWSVATGQELAVFEGYSGVMLEEDGRSLVIQPHKDGKYLQPEIIQIPTLDEIDRTEDRK